MNDLHDLAAAYVLDALDPGERAEYEVHLAGCDQCRTEVAELRETAASLRRALAAEPSPGLRDRVLAQVTATPQVSIRPDASPAGCAGPPPRTAAAPPPVAPPSRALTAWLAAAVVALVLGAAALGFLAVRLDQRLDDVSTRLAATEAQLEETEGQLASTEARLAETESELVSAGELRAVLASNDGSVVSLTGPGEGTMRFAYSPTTGQGVLIGDGLAPVDEARDIPGVADRRRRSPARGAVLAYRRRGHIRRRGRPRRGGGGGGHPRAGRWVTAANHGHPLSERAHRGLSR